MLAAMFAVTNLGLMFGQGIFVKYATVELGLSVTEYGILLAVTAALVVAIGLRVPLKVDVGRGTDWDQAH